MKRLFLLPMLFLTSCDAQDTTKATCTAVAKGNSPDLFKPPSSRHDNTLLILSGDKTEVLSRCSGAVVGHNAVLTTASCKKGDMDSVYVLSRSPGFFHDADATVKTQILAEAKRPRRIVLPEIISTVTPGVTAEPNADDLAILIFEDNSFSEQLVRTDFYLVGSLYEPTRRPLAKQSVITLGYKVDSLKRAFPSSKSAPYTRDDNLLKGLIFAYDIEFLPESASLLSSDRKFAADKGAPMLAWHNQSQGFHNLVGVLIHAETIKTEGQPASQLTNSGEQSRGLYVDLYSERSINLLKKARTEGAVFLKPEDLPKAIPLPGPTGSGCG